MIETTRLTLSEFTSDDAPFIITLLNTPGWLRFIGDRNIKTLADANSYLEKGPMQSYKTFGFGLYKVSLKPDSTSIGMCGLIKRESLDDVDIGFAFLPEYAKQGYAFEAGSATLSFAKETLKLNRILAITSQDNVSSIALLEKIGLRAEKKITLPNDSEELMLFVI